MTEDAKPATVRLFGRGAMVIVVPTWRGFQDVDPAVVVNFDAEAVTTAVLQAIQVCRGLPSAPPEAAAPVPAWSAVGVVSERAFNDDLGLASIRFVEGGWEILQWTPEGRGFKLTARRAVASADAGVAAALEWLRTGPRHPPREPHSRVARGRVSGR